MISEHIQRRHLTVSQKAVIGEEIAQLPMGANQYTVDEASAAVTKNPGSRAAGVAMAIKLIESAQARWRCVNAPHLVALVRAGATFINGKLVERPDDQDQQGGEQKAA
jgi:hypothetical protein